MIPPARVLLGWIEEYAGLGLHRTGSPGDQASSHWLLWHLRARGIAAAPVAFSFPRFAWREAAVFVGAVRIEGTPLHDAGSTGRHGVAGEFPVLEDPDKAALDSALQAHRGSQGLIVVTGDPEDCVRPLEAPGLGLQVDEAFLAAHPPIEGPGYS